ncbi:type II toxin-antitoxin system HicB family antitoxin [Pelagibaculum spongiae]|uniref:HicB-like antitoxin of toxin-antitoxin system domain-containing protein n=1 Tax=Pelagibaculum spongiae TaxID=2080658 RepID=A0A2V1H1F1_9GAMM|nr:type II toxin-antitoxin system HicB family antitoxin [Pelagibaculum spongiae]PVZ71790.1 hypothetical protein DC094_01825 [Pelagibaculum spongiae]
MKMHVLPNHDKGQSFSVTVPDFPLTFSTGEENLEQALACATEAMQARLSPIELEIDLLLHSAAFRSG